MEALLLIAYVALPALTWWRSRSLGFAVVAVVASVSVFGVLINFALEMGFLWSRASLQLLLLVALAAAAGAAFVWPRSGPAPLSRGVLAVVVPVVLLLAFLIVVTWVLTEEPAFLRPVGYLIGHGTAEDNAKWLDFTAKFASGDSISQFVPLGGPLQLALTFIGTLMGVISMVMLEGYNEVAVAANTVVLGSYLLVALTPLALAPLAEGVRVRREASSESSSLPVPWPLIWLGSAVLVSASLVVTGYGHLTFQYTIIVMAVWSSVFLTGRWGLRGLLVASLAAATTVTVWLPLNALAAVVLAAWLVVFIVRLARKSSGAVDPLSWGLWLVVAVALWAPIWSSLSYVAGSVSAAASSALGGAVRGVVALVVPANDSSLFSAPGGTEQAGPLLMVLAAAALVGAAWVVSGSRPRRGLVALAPVVLLILFAVLITLVDFWVTGAGPNYGSLKFTFLAAVIVAGVCLPVALLALDWPSSGMTAVRWLGVVAVVALLTVDTLLPRALASARPSQWSPPIPFENTSGSYWYPADVNGEATQPIADNPVACVYLPAGATVPTALLDSQLSDAQRVYNCSRVLAGLSGMDHDALPIVDWLRREWLTNTRAWAEMYPRFEELSDAVLAKPVILLDDGSNVVGIETFGSLLSRFPKFAGKTPEELAALGVDPSAQ